MRMQHTPSHWVVVALVLLALLLTLREARGQTGAAAAFEGRPALAGAQAGLGAQAGPPQGGIGVQGTQAAERGVHLRRPSGLATPKGEAVAASSDLAVAPAAPLLKPKDTGYAPEQRSAVRKTKRAARRTIRRARTGTAEIDAH